MTRTPLNRLRKERAHIVFIRSATAPSRNSRPHPTQSLSSNKRNVKCVQQQQRSGLFRHLSRNTASLYPQSRIISRITIMPSLDYHDEVVIRLMSSSPRKNLKLMV